MAVKTPDGPDVGVSHSVPEPRVYLSAVERARALLNDMTGGRQAPTRAAWAAIEETLCRSYSLLRNEPGTGLDTATRPVS